MGQYNPLVFNATENAAYNAADTCWFAAEQVFHYGVLPYYGLPWLWRWTVGPLVSRGWDWAMGARPRPPVAPAPAVAPVPAPTGIFSRFYNGTKNVLKKVAAAGAYFAVSHKLNSVWFTENVWQNLKPVGTAFMRPLFEKIIPSAYGMFDKGDLDFSFRQFVPGGEGTWASWFATPLVGIRNWVNKAILGRGPTLIDLHAIKAYAYGESFARTVEELALTTRDILWSTSQIGPCLASPEATDQCWSEAKAYLSHRGSTIWEVSAPMREVLMGWGHWGLESVKQGGTSILYFTGNRVIDAAKGLATGAGHAARDATGIEWIDAPVKYAVYAAELAIALNSSYRLFRFSKHLAADFIYYNVVPAKNYVSQKAGLFLGWRAPVAAPVPVPVPAPIPAPIPAPAPGAGLPAPVPGAGVGGPGGL